MSIDTPIIGADGDDRPGTEPVKDTTTQDFMRDVVEASQQRPVLVDFWAPWCGPCKQLTPLLEKAVRASRGAVALVKMNIDEHPEIPGQMGVQSIPAVFAFKDGRPVDGFMGALPESQINSFIAKLVGETVGTEADIETATAALEAGDVNSAAQIFGQILQDEPDNMDALAGLAKCYVKTGDLERAEQTLALAPPNKADSGPILAAQSALDLARKSNDAGDIDAARAKAELAPNDPQAQFDLALALNAGGDREGALDVLLSIVAKNRSWNDDAARKQLVQFFEVWGPGDPATTSGRQRLSSLLFA
ncbi:MAG: thioredoxin [Pseudomonadota bacterium]